MESSLLLKTLHMAGACLFLGNLIVTGWWKMAADRTGDAKIIAFAQRQVIHTDWVFTCGGACLLGGSGIVGAMSQGIALTSFWILGGIVLFAASGLIWGGILLPLQRRQAALARTFAHGGPIPDGYWRLNRAWMTWGMVATLLPVAAIPLMVWKAV